VNEDSARRTDCLVETVVEQDAEILSKLCDDSPQLIKLNHEIGMDWV
jgi:hypothetical protein